jgi:hypothetical protein
MEVLHWKECEDKKIAQFPYRGEMHDVTGTSVRWLSKSGDDGHGYPEYGLRFFTIQPGGESFTTISIIRPCSSCQANLNAGNSTRKRMN